MLPGNSRFRAHLSARSNRVSHTSGAAGFAFPARPTHELS